MRPITGTYRVQLRPGFGFDDVAAVAPYLASLGVSHVYCSPYLQAAPGSTHGYDVVDHTCVNVELGGADAHARMVAALDEHGLGQVVDVVPNHMAVGTPANRWWWDVLRNGRDSPFARNFDVDWDPPDAKLRETVLLPVLGDHYGRVLESGEIRLVEGDETDGGPVAVYHDHRFPLAPGSLGTATVDEANADVDVLDSVLQRQHWRLAWWRTASQELDYRRFFDIDTLVGIRVEDPDVFHPTHDLVVSWVRDGQVDGLRIDHPDGLRDPEGYLRRLWDETGGAWIVVEKILEGEERLRLTWPVAGTTGYEFARVAGGLFVDPAGEEPLTKLCAELGIPTDWEETVAAAKAEILRGPLASDVRRLVGRLVAVCEGHRRYRDYTQSDIHDTLFEVLASFDVYRTYVVEGRATDEDRRIVDAALGRARTRRPDLDEELVAFIGRLLSGELTGPSEDEFVARFQQLSGPVMAKAVEDTAFYRFPRLTALNEVGGDPGRFATGLDHFHAQPWSEGLLSTSTHDTKRSEDVRARLSLLSELPDKWAAAVRRWTQANRRHRTGDWPDPATEYLVYQTLVGAHPLPLGRARPYVEKAIKEAKVHTSWTDPDPDYESAVLGFVQAIVDDPEFAADLDAFVAPLVEPGRVNSLALTLLRLTAAGTPDTYQGTELWDLSLVDPDNRRPVDYGARSALLDEIESLDAEAVLERSDEGLPKLLVVSRALRLRRRLGALGPQTRLDGRGPRADHAVAFARGDDLVTVVPRLVIGFRAAGGWGDTTVALPEGGWVDQLTGARWEGGEVEVRSLLGRFPVSLLARP